MDILADWEKLASIKERPVLYGIAGLQGTDGGFYPALFYPGYYGARGLLIENE